MPPILSRQATMLDNMIDRSFLGAMRYSLVEHIIAFLSFHGIATSSLLCLLSFKDCLTSTCDFLFFGKRRWLWYCSVISLRSGFTYRFSFKFQVVGGVANKQKVGS